MNINPINIARAIDHNSSSNKFQNRTSPDISVEVTENLEPGENDIISSNNPQIQTQYKPSAPIVKSSPTSKEILEVINYEDLLEKTLSESETADKQILIGNELQPVNESTKEIGKGFYLTISKSDMEKMSNYAKGDKNKAEAYSSRNKTKKGVLVDLIV